MVSDDDLCKLLFLGNVVNSFCSSSLKNAIPLFTAFRISFENVCKFPRFHTSGCFYILYFFYLIFDVCLPTLETLCVGISIYVSASGKLLQYQNT